MSIITPSRVDLFSPAHHNPTAVNFGPLQPSAMPQPPPSVSPHPSKGFTIPSNIDSRYREREREAQNDPVDVWRKSIVARALPVNEQPSRGALGRIDVNAASKSSRPSASASTNIAKNAGKTLSSRPATTRTDSNSIIPKLAPEPDVFGPSVSIASTSRTVSTLKANPLFQAANNSIQSGKRGRNDALLGPVQLFRDNTLATEDSHGAKRVKHEKGPANVVTGTGDVKRDRETFRMEEENWRAKWIKLFPGLVFHFEVGAEQGSAGRAMMNRVLKMGAKVDQFFSTKVTHLIVKNHASPQKAKSMAPPPRRKDSVRESPKNPFLDGTGVTDLAKKAEAMNMKVWTTEKLSSMLSRLAPVTNGNANNSLHTLLEDEKIHGTRERDLTAPRPDYFYFKPGSKYLLIEDATGRHRTVMWKEYGFGNKEDGVWPTLHEQFLRPPTSANCNVPLGNLRERAWTLYVEGKAYKEENPPCSIDAGTSTLKRSTSLRAIPGTPILPQVEELPYQNASGNSVNLTSNIASTSTANHSPAMLGQTGFMGTYKDRAITQMNRRVQVLKGNARLAASKRTSGGQELDLSGLPNNRRTAAPPPAPAPSVSSSSTAMPMRTFLTQDQLVKMLEQARAPVAENENVTAEMRRRNRERVWAGLKGRDQDTAAGYCENCRVRYTDLSVHIASRKHRRFACDEENFQSLDKLLAMLRRPGHPDLITSDFPPCPHRHAKTHSCGLCDYWQSEKASSLHSPPSDEMDAETNLLSSPFKGEESGSGSEQCSQETQPHDY